MKYFIPYENWTEAQLNDDDPYEELQESDYGVDVNHDIIVEQLGKYKIINTGKGTKEWYIVAVPVLNKVYSIKMYQGEGVIIESD